jgi:hypothetical protein
MPQTTTYLHSVPDAGSADVPALLRRVRTLTAGYLAISLAAVGALLLHAGGNAAAWTHGIIVAVTAGASLSAAIRAGRGRRGAYLRLRVLSVVVVVAMIVIAALPGDFPLWMKLAELAGAALMAVVAVTVNARPLREHFRRG